MSDPQQRFQMLAQQFQVLERNLCRCQNPEQRWGLLKEMNVVLVLEELDQFILANQSLLDSKLASIPAHSTGPPAISPTPPATQSLQNSRSKRKEKTLRRSQTARTSRRGFYLP
jgi:hypothetical protein